MIRWLALLLIALPCSAQTWSTWNGKTVGSSTGNVSAMNGKTIGTATNNYNKWNNLASPSGGGGGTWTAHAGVTCQNGGSAVTVASCTLTGVSAGDLIAVQVGDNDCVISSVNDGVNSGNYSVVYANQSDSSDPNCSGQYYFKNSASGAFTVAANASTSDSYIHIAAEAYTDSAGGTSPTQDTAFSSSGSPFFHVSAGAVNANCGTAKTPSAANELVIAYVESDATTPTTGSGFTAIATNQSHNPSTGQYQIQTTATSTNGPFVNTTDDWGAGCAAFKP